MSEDKKPRLKIIIISLALFYSGCSTCAFVFDPLGPGKSYCYAKKSQEKYCNDHGGPHKEYTITPVSFDCADGTNFHGYGKKWSAK